MEHNAVVLEHQRHNGLLSVVAAANLVGVSKYTLRSWIRQRRISHIRLGRRVLLDPRDLDRFVQAGRIEARISR